MARFRTPGVNDPSKYAAGAVVWTLEVPDHHGNRKDRPIVLLTSEADEWIGVAVSTVEPGDGEQHFCVEMLWAMDGHHKTGLDRPCWAICPWKVKAGPNQLRGRMGFVPSSHLKRILALA
jgi:hypothetical protein